MQRSIVALILHLARSSALLPYAYGLCLSSKAVRFDLIVCHLLRGPMIPSLVVSAPPNWLQSYVINMALEVAQLFLDIGPTRMNGHVLDLRWKGCFNACRWWRGSFLDNVDRGSEKKALLSRVSTQQRLQCCKM